MRKVSVYQFRHLVLQGQERNEKGVCVPIACPEGQERNEGGVCGCPIGLAGTPPYCEVSTT